MYFKSSFWYLPLVIFFFNLCIGCIRCTTFCEISNRHQRNNENVTRIFNIISGSTRFRNRLSVVVSDLEELPRKTLYANKLHLMGGIELLRLKNDEIASFSLLFLEDLFDFYKSKEGSSLHRLSDLLDSRLYTLLSLIIRETVPIMKLNYSVKTLVQCLHATPIAQYSVMGALGINEQLIEAWKHMLQSSIKQYNGFKRSFKKAWHCRTRPPTASCRNALNRMARGCPPGTTSDAVRQTSNLCVPFCKNVLLGCLAPQLLQAPISSDRQEQEESYQTFWRHVLSSSSSSSGEESDQVSVLFNLFFSSVNASNILRIVGDGLANASVSQDVLVYNVKTICDATLSNQYLESTGTSSVVQVPTTTAPSTGGDRLKDPEGERDRVGTAGDGQLLYRSEMHKLTDFVNRLRSRLVRLAEEQVNVRKLSDTALRRFCHLEVAGDSTDCWTGDEWAPPTEYKKAVPEFSTTAQRSNPEVPFEPEESINEPDISQSSVNHVYEERAVNEDSQARIDEVGVGQPHLGDDYASSGFLHLPQEGPVSLPFDFLAPIPSLPDPAPGDRNGSLPLSDDLWPKLPPLERADCPTDDEDCFQSSGKSSRGRDRVEMESNGSAGSTLPLDLATPTRLPTADTITTGESLHQGAALRNSSQATSPPSTNNTTVTSAKPKDGQSRTKPSPILPGLTLIVLLHQMNAHDFLYFGRINIF